MNILEILRRDDEALRRCVAEMQRAAGRPEDVGSADYFPDGGLRLMRELKAFQAALRIHERLEKRFAADLAREPDIEGSELAAALEQGQRVVEESARWLDVVFGIGDDGRAYRIRTMLDLLVRDLEGHLACEDRVAARLRDGLSGEALERLGLSAVVATGVRS
jgi:hypothetical protein